MLRLERDEWAMAELLRQATTSTLLPRPPRGHTALFFTSLADVLFPFFLIPFHV